MATTLSLYHQIKEICPEFPKINVEERDVFLSDFQLISIKKCLIDLFKQGHSNYVQGVFKEIVQNPHRNNGKIYEVLVYHWLQTTCTRFELQPTIEKDDCFKKKGNYEADERICDVVFDIKLFGIGFPLLEKVREEFQLMADVDKK